MLIVKILR